jgi:hypothetical protein
MQKRKALHRAVSLKSFAAKGCSPAPVFPWATFVVPPRRFLSTGRSLPHYRIVAAIGAFLLVTLLAGRFGKGESGWDSPPPYRGGADWPRERVGPFDRSLKGGYIACLTSYANPYGIEDLRLFHAALGVRRERLGLLLSWAGLTHPLYRGDRLAARIGRTLSPLPLALAVQCAIERSAVTGYPAVYSAGFEAAAVAMGPRWALTLGIVPARDAQAVPVAFGCSADLGPLAVVLSGRAVRAGICDPRAAVGLSLDETSSLSIGYRVETDELCYGLVCRRQKIFVTVGWRDHPVLGRTGAVGVGWIWPR